MKYYAELEEQGAASMTVALADDAIAELLDVFGTDLLVDADVVKALKELRTLREQRAALMTALETLVYGWAAAPSNDNMEEYPKWDYEFNGAMVKAREVLARVRGAE